MMPKDDILGKIAIAAGVENALSVMQETGLPTIAVPGDAFLHSIPIPDGVVEIEIHADGDKSGERAAYKAMETYRMQEYLVTKIIYETDANDSLQKKYKGDYEKYADERIDWIADRAQDALLKELDELEQDMVDSDE